MNMQKKQLLQDIKRAGVLYELAWFCDTNCNCCLDIVWMAVCRGEAMTGFDSMEIKAEDIKEKPWLKPVNDCIISLKQVSYEWKKPLQEVGSLKAAFAKQYESVFNRDLPIVQVLNDLIKAEEQLLWYKSQDVDTLKKCIDEMIDYLDGISGSAKETAKDELPEIVEPAKKEELKLSVSKEFLEGLQ